MQLWRCRKGGAKIWGRRFPQDAERCGTVAGSQRCVCDTFGEGTVASAPNERLLVDRTWGCEGQCWAGAPATIGVPPVSRYRATGDPEGGAAGRRRTQSASPMPACTTTAHARSEFTRPERRLLEFLIQAKRQGRIIGDYGAPGEGDTLLNYCGAQADFLQYTDFLQYKRDRNLDRQGRLPPGPMSHRCAW